MKKGRGFFGGLVHARCIALSQERIQERVRHMDSSGIRKKSSK